MILNDEFVVLKVNIRNNIRKDLSSCVCVFVGFVSERWHNPGNFLTPMMNWRILAQTGADQRGRSPHLFIFHWTLLTLLTRRTTQVCANDWSLYKPHVEISLGVSCRFCVTFLWKMIRVNSNIWLEPAELHLCSMKPLKRCQKNDF